MNVEKTLKYCIELYETIKFFTLHRNDKIFGELINHMKYLTGVEQILFIRLLPLKEKGSYVSCGLQEKEEADLLLHVIDLLEEGAEKDTTKYCNWEDKNLSIYFATYEEIPCGAFFTIEDTDAQLQKSSFVRNSSKESKEEIINLNCIIPIFMKIAGIVLKRLEFDESEKHISISDEQKRIVKDIQDNLQQKLFAISCRLYLLSKEDEDAIEEDRTEEIFEIKESIHLIITELREAIHGFSWGNHHKLLYTD